MLRDRGRHAEARTFLAESSGQEGVAGIFAREQDRRKNGGLKFAHLEAHILNWKRQEVLNEYEVARLALDEGRWSEVLPTFVRLTDDFRRLVDAVPAKQAEALLKDDPFGPFAKDLSYFAWCWRNIGIAQHELGRHSEAEKAFSEGFRRIEGLENPDLLAVYHGLPLHRSICQAGDPAHRHEADAGFDRLIAALEIRVRDFGNAENRRMLVRTYVERGLFRAANDRTLKADAGADFLAARKLCESLVAECEKKPAVDDLTNLGTALAG